MEHTRKIAMNQRLREYREVKYIMPFDAAQTIQAQFRTFASPDKRGVDGAYCVSSIYFDTPQLNCLQDKIEGEMNKVKIRLRSYRSSDQSCWGNFFLEIKIRILRSVQKRRIPLSREQADEILQQGVSNAIIERLLGEKPPIEVHRLLYKGFYRPVAEIRYRRVALFFREISDMRITFDSEIAALSPSFSTQELPLKSDFKDFLSIPGVLEIKSYGNPLPVFRYFLEKNRLHQTSISKFALGLEFLLERQSDPRSISLNRRNFVKIV